MPNFDVVLTHPGSKKIQVIKAIREIAAPMSLKDAKHLVDKTPSLILQNVESRLARDAHDFLVETGATVDLREHRNAQDQGSSAPEPQSRALQAGHASLRLVNFGQRKINVIKVVRSHTGLGLKDAKHLVDVAPSLILQDVSEYQAQAAAEELESVGATVELIRPEVEQAVSAPVSTSAGLSLFLKSYGSRKISVIKDVRSVLGIGLKEAKDLVERAPVMLLEEAAAPRIKQLADALALSGATVEIRDPSPLARPEPVHAYPPAEQTLTLTSWGVAKIQVIKVVRAALGLGLKDAKDLVESAPVVLLNCVPSDDAQRLADKLEAVGASVKLR